jgi:ribosomal protein S8
MFYHFANAIANIKGGMMTKRLIVRCTTNKLNLRILHKFVLEGYIRGFGIDSLNSKKLCIFLKYDEQYNSILRNLKVISTPGNRVYFSYKRVLEAYSRGETYLLTTTKGLFTINEIIYFRLQIGGEVILQIFFY